MRMEELYHHLLSEAFDRDDPADGDRRKLVICTTPRTAGHACCRQLSEFGLGVPTEYFQWQYALPLMRRWTAAPELDLNALEGMAAEYGRLLLKHRSRGGVFAAKIFHENHDFIRAALGGDDDTWLYIRLARRDKVAQTISLLSLIYTGRPFDSDDQLADMILIGQIGPEAVRKAVNFIHDAEMKWANRLASIPAARQATLVYEDFVADPAGALKQAVGAWFRELAETDDVRHAAGRRYSTDRDLKAQIEDRYGDEIARMWKAMPPTGFQSGAP